MTRLRPPIPTAQALGLVIRRLQARASQASEPEGLFGPLLDELVSLSGSAAAVVGRAVDDDRSPALEILAAVGSGPDAARWQHGARDRRLDDALRADEPAIVASPDGEGLLLGLPLWHGEHRLGLLALASGADGWDPALPDALRPVAVAVGAILTGHRLRDRDSLLHKLTQEVPGVIHQLERSPDGRLTMPYASDGLREAYELLPDEVRDDARPILARVHPDDAASMWQATLRSFETLEPWRATYRVLLPKAGLRWHEAHSAAERLPDGSVRWTGYIADITDRKGYEEAMVAAVAAQRANLAKTEFLSRMSHELRTPLNAVLGFSQLLLLGEALTEDQRVKLRHIHTAGGHLLAMINDVLDLSRIETGTIALSLDVVQVEAAAAEALAMVAALARQAGIRLSLQPPPARGDAPAGACVRADHVRLRQILVNLLSNAVKYNRPGGSASIDWRVTQDAREVVIGVVDTGLGLTAAQQAHLYEPFNRLGAERSKVEGTGIGLVLSRRLAELMQGEIAVDSEVGRGSRFELRLPLAVPQAPPAMPDVVPPPRPHAARKLLYAEDNPLNVELVAQVLRLRPAWQLLTARSGAQALELAQAERPDLLLLDMHLGDMTGIDLARRLDRSPHLRGRPRVALSADAMPERRREAAEAGFADYLTKPLDVDALLRCLDRHLGDAPPP